MVNKVQVVLIWGNSLFMVIVETMGIIRVMSEYLVDAISLPGALWDHGDPDVQLPTDHDPGHPASHVKV